MNVVMKEQLYQWYIIENRSYRFIMDQIGRNNARFVKKLLIENGIEIRKGSEAVKTQWINADQRRVKTSDQAKKLFAPFWGTQTKRPEVAAKISASKLGSRNPMWGKTGELNSQFLGGKKTWERGRKMTNKYRQFVFDHFENKCGKCGAIDKLTIHHDPPWREIKSHDIKYLSVLCEGCHFQGPNHLR